MQRTPPPTLLIAAIALVTLTQPGAIALEPLSDADVMARMQTLPGWQRQGNELVCTYPFRDFVESIQFVNQIVEPAEALGHHPDLQISYSTVTVSLTTHDAGGLTELDFELAEAISSLTPVPCQSR